VRLVLVPA